MNLRDLAFAVSGFIAGSLSIVFIVGTYCASKLNSYMNKSKKISNDPYKNYMQKEEG